MKAILRIVSGRNENDIRRVAFWIGLIFLSFLLYKFYALSVTDL